jgi:hypothetical protein
MKKANTKNQNTTAAERLEYRLIRKAGIVHEDGNSTYTLAAINKMVRGAKKEIRKQYGNRLVRFIEPTLQIGAKGSIAIQIHFISIVDLAENQQAKRIDVHSILL